MTITLATRLQKVEASATLALNAKAKQLQHSKAEKLLTFVSVNPILTPQNISHKPVRKPLRMAKPIILLPMALLNSNKQSSTNSPAITN